VADDTEPANAVMEPVETRRLELPQPARDDPAPASDARLEAMVEMDVDAVGEEVPAPKPFRILDELLELESDRREIGGNDRTGADAHDSIDGHAVPNQLTEHADVCRATQAAGAEDDRYPSRAVFPHRGFYCSI